MKTAYELAMERLGGATQYSGKQKAALADIDARCEAKKAEAKLGADTRLKDAGGDPAKREEIRAELAAELARLEEKREAAKEEVRRKGGE